MKYSNLLQKIYLVIILISTCFATSTLAQPDVGLRSSSCYLNYARVTSSFYASSIPEDEGVIAYKCANNISSESPELRSGTHCNWAKGPSGNAADAISNETLPVLFWKSVPQPMFYII